MPAGVDVFKNTTLKFGGAFTADKGILVANRGLEGILMQSLQIQYQQAITKLYELGTTGQDMHVYYVGGRSQGTLNVARVIGPKVALQTFYDNFSDVCKANGNDIKVELTKVDCGGGGATTVSYNCLFCVLVSIGIQVQANDLVINENSSLQFSNMEFDGP